MRSDWNIENHMVVGDYYFEQENRRLGRDEPITAELCGWERNCSECEWGRSCWDYVDPEEDEEEEELEEQE